MSPTRVEVWGPKNFDKSGHFGHLRKKFHSSVKKMSSLRGWEGIPLNFCISENQNVFFQNIRDFPSENS